MTLEEFAALQQLLARVPLTPAEALWLRPWLAKMQAQLKAEALAAQQASETARATASKTLQAAVDDMVKTAISNGGAGA